MPKYYEVPPEVVEHYPGLIDDYIRAGTAATQADDYDPWEVVGSDLAKGFATGFQNIVGEYTRRDAEERAFRRKADYETHKQEETLYRQQALADQKAQLKADEEAAEMSRGRTAAQKFYQRAATMGGDYNQAFAVMMQEDPETATNFMNWMATVGKAGAPADFFKLQLGGLGAKKAEVAEAQGNRRLDQGDRRLDQQETAQAERLQYLYDQLAQNEAIAQRVNDAKTRGLDMREQEFKVREQNGAIKRQLDQALIENLQARTKKAIADGTGANGRKTFTALQQTQYDTFMEIARKELGDDAAPEDVKKLTDYYMTFWRQQMGSESNFKVDPQTGMPGTVRTPTNPFPKPGGGGGPVQGGSAYDKTITRLDSLPEISEEGIAAIRENMRRFTPAQQQEIERRLKTKPVKKKR